MSMGRKMTAAVLALKAENRLPPGIRTKELEQLLYCWMKDHGSRQQAARPPDILPSSGSTAGAYRKR